MSSSPAQVRAAEAEAVAADRAISSVRRFESRAEIEAAGFVPGWHGEPVNVGDAVVIHGHGSMRQAVATKVTPTYVHAVFVTPTNVEQAQKLSVTEASLDVEHAARIVRKNELENGRYFVRAVAGGRDRYQSDAQWAAYQAYAAEGPEAYAERKVEEMRRQFEARIARARSGGWQQYVTVVKGKGDRIGRRSNLYVLPVPAVVLDKPMPENEFSRWALDQANAQGDE